MADEAPATRFAAHCRTRADEATGNRQAVIRGEDGWLFLTSELRHLGVGTFWGEAAQQASAATREDARDPLPVIVDTARQLREAGIALLVVPVPPRAVVYADRIWGDAPRDAAGHPVRLDAALQAFHARLREEQVAVLDLTEAFVAARVDDAKEGHVYCRLDSHWSPRGIVIAAREIATWLRGHGVEAPSALRTEVHVEAGEVAGDLWRLLEEASLTRETLSLRRVTVAGGAAVEEYPLSQVLLLADSHGLVFHAGDDMLAAGGGLFDHLSAALGFPVALMARRGSAATTVRIDLARRSRTEPEFMKRKKAIVWCFAARELTESSGWRQVPLFP